MIQTTMTNPTNSECACGQLHANKRRPGSFAARSDPSRTGNITTPWISEVHKRFAALRKDLRAYLVTDDTLKLNFKFDSNPKKVAGFRRWVNSRVKSGFFTGITTDDPVSAYQGKWWANKYVQTSYKQGMIRAIDEMKKAGMKGVKNIVPIDSKDPRPVLEAAFLRPTHLDRVESIYARNYEALNGITAQMSSRMSGILAEGLANGDGPYKTADRLEKEIGISEARANMIARTETIRAHHVAMINTFREAGVLGVQVQAEVLTAGDDRVCEKCGKWEERSQKKPIPLDVVEPLIPFHPNCRCVVIPAIDVDSLPQDPMEQGELPLGEMSRSEEEGSE